MSTGLQQRAELALRLAETWVRRPSSPTRVVLAATRRCNLRCNMCLTWKTPVGAPVMSPAEIAATMRQLKRLTWLDVTGGEIFFRPDAEEVFEAIIETTPALRVLHFPTNGWFSDRVVATAEAIVARRPDLDLIVTVSIDGPRAVHDAIRGREGSYERAVATLCALRERGVSTYVGTTLSSASEPHLDALRAELEQVLPDFDDRCWHWNWLQSSEQFFKNSAVASDLSSSRHRDRLREQVRRRGLPRNPVDLMELGFLLNLERYLSGEPTGVPCQSLRSTCFISPEGDLYPCHVWDRPLGNVLDTPFDALWNAPETRVARDEVVRLDCGGCFTPCEAYPALAGSPVAAMRGTALGAVRMLAEVLRPTGAGSVDSTTHRGS